MAQISKHPPRTPRQAAACCGPIDGLLDPAVFKALCDPTRLSLVACIAKCGRGCGVSEVAECCDVDLSVVSRHLALLAREGVLEAEKDGRTMKYAVKYADLCCWLRALADALEGCCPDGPATCRGRCSTKPFTRSEP